MNSENLWQAALAQIQLLISQANFATWFKDTKIETFEEGKITILAPNSFVKEWLEQKYQKIIFKVLKSLNPNIKTINFEVNSKKEIKKKNFEKVFFPQLQMTKLIEIDGETNLNKKYTFSNFVVGPFNELAFAAAQAIVKNPGKIYNPFFVYGGVGLGKTHLLQAIGNEIKKNFKNLKIKYLPVNFLVSEIINAIKNKTIENLKQSFKEIDLLLLDDVQFLAGKEKTQEEFFFIFNSLYEKEKQIVISSDRPPKAISSLTERLRSRFEGGVIADISVPDFESRVAILKLKSQEKGINFSEEILNYIASNIKNNIRELEGALNLLIAGTKIHQKEIDLKRAKELLKTLISPTSKISNFKKLIKVVCEFYEIKEEEVFSKSRKREIVKPRQVAMYLLRKDFNYSFSSIARKFGGKDHTTVIHACEKIEEKIKKDQNFFEEIKEIKKRLSI